MNYGRLWEVIAAGNLIPAKSFQARTVNFEYLPADEKELSSFAGWMGDVYDLPAEFKGDFEIGGWKITKDNNKF